MDPALLLTFGPTLLRGIGKLFGGRTERVADNVAAMADEVRDLPGDLAQAKLTQRMAAMPVEDLAELKKIEVKLAEIEQEREAARLQAQTARHAEDQATRRSEIASTDVYVRRTRPYLARLSTYVTFLYLGVSELVFPVVNAAKDTSLPHASEWMVMALFAPALSYIGARTVDSFSARGKT